MGDNNPVILSSLEGLEVLLEAEEDTSLKVAQRMLVGKVLTSKSLNKGVVKEILAKAWGQGDSLTTMDLGPNTFLFNFTQAKHARRVMDEGPWNNLPKTWVSIKYERLQGFCYNCGVLGHDFRKCTKPQVMNVMDESRPRYPKYIFTSFKAEDQLDQV
ncbi:Zinc finger, CCHC-type [Sesbania bispinosa]|nr:Zinc finger, CCHC-type [Sesbania bispinosa]